MAASTQVNPSQRVVMRVSLLKWYLSFPILALLVLVGLSFADETSVGAWILHIPESIADQFMFIYYEIVRSPVSALKMYGPLLLGIIPFLYLAITRSLSGARKAVLVLLALHAVYGIQYASALIRFAALPGVQYMYFALLSAALLTGTILLIVLLVFILRSMRMLVKRQAA
jgi:hypothetical protein